MGKLKRIIFTSILFFSVLVIFFDTNIETASGNRKEAELVVFGDNINTEYKPFVENTGIYLSKDIIEKYLDEYIYYDKVATKVIITTKNEVYKLKIDENKMSKNFENVDIQNPAKIVNGQAYVDINLFKEIYGIKVAYNEKTSTISIDNLSTSDTKVKYNNIKVYEDITTKSNILTTIGKNNTVSVYTESLKHNRWYKVKTDDGTIGYVAKNTVDLNVDENNEEIQNNEISSENNDNNQNDEDNEIKEKITMFWQYGSNLNTLGNKIDGVDVVSPTWYELKNSFGEINSEYNQKYYNKAKTNGYEIWPIVTNGIDSVDYMPADTSAMLNSEQNRENFIKNLLKLAKEHDLDGINIDFESMKEEDRLVYTQFIRELAPIFRSEGIKVSVDMYFVSYIDRKGIGAASDYVILMGYDQRGSWSSESGSISEISWVEKNIDSLINSSNIPPEKIILGVPFYTRLWTEKSGNSKPTTKVYDMQDCQDFLKYYGLTATYDEKSGQNYAEYTKGSTTYKLWIEDDTSMKNRIGIINKYNLAGLSAWQKGLETDNIWSVISENMK